VPQLSQKKIREEVNQLKTVNASSRILAMRKLEEERAKNEATEQQIKLAAELRMKEREAFKLNKTKELPAQPVKKDNIVNSDKGKDPKNSNAIKDKDLPTPPIFSIPSIPSFFTTKKSSQSVKETSENTAEKEALKKHKEEDRIAKELLEKERAEAKRLLEEEMRQEMELQKREQEIRRQVAEIKRREAELLRMQAEEQRKREDALKKEQLDLKRKEDQLKREAEQRDRERLQKEAAELKKLEELRRGEERKEKERVAAERKKIEDMRKEEEKREKERLKREAAEKKRLEDMRKEEERREKERLKREAAEQKRLEDMLKDEERKEKERLKKEAAEQKRQEELRREEERAEIERVKREAAEKKRRKEEKQRAHIERKDLPSIPQPSFRYSTVFNSPLWSADQPKEEIQMMENGEPKPLIKTKYKLDEISSEENAKVSVDKSKYILRKPVVKDEVDDSRTQKYQLDDFSDDESKARSAASKWMEEAIELQKKANEEASKYVNGADRKKSIAAEEALKVTMAAQANMRAKEQKRLQLEKERIEREESEKREKELEARKKKEIEERLQQIMAEEERKFQFTTDGLQVQKKEADEEFLENAALTFKTMSTSKSPSNPFVKKKKADLLPDIPKVSQGGFGDDLIKTFDQYQGTDDQAPPKLPGRKPPSRTKNPVTPKKGKNGCSIM
jgi:hypothetical protein